MTQPLLVFLCGTDLPGTMVREMFPAFGYNGNRFIVSGMTATWSDVGDLIQHRLDVVVIEAGIAPSADELQSCLTRLVNTTPITVVLVVAREDPSITYHFDGVDRVKIWRAPVNWRHLAERTYSFVQEHKASQGKTPADEKWDLII